MGDELTEYLWIAVVGTFFGFWYAYGIGANDVANAFASTVAAGSLTLKQAVIVAAVFEFSGAFFLGASVTSTIRNKIFDVKLYSDTPEIVMLGMMTSIIVATAMLMIATMYGAPVSTTHTIVGCIMGFSIAAKGFDSINWDLVIQIFISWAASPLLSGVLAFFFFLAVKYGIMNSEHAFDRAVFAFPVVLTLGVGIDLFYILLKGLTNTKWKDDLKVKYVLPISFGIGLVCGLIWLIFVGPIIKRRVIANMAIIEAKRDADALEEGKVKEFDTDSPNKEYEEGAEETVDVDLPVKNEKIVLTAEEIVEARANRGLYQRFSDATFGQDLRTQSYNESSRAEQLWDNDEGYDPYAEELFTYVQVLTACLNSFAHGANDVANAIAPVSAILYIYQTGELKSKSPVQKWVLAYGGLGIVVGLLLYGYKVMKSLGYKLTPLSPSRGACAELAASLFVVTASFLGIPVSSTQSIVGAVAGVGLVGGFKNVDWIFLAKVCLSWAIVFFSAVIFSAGLFSMLAFSPSLASPIGSN